MTGGLAWVDGALLPRDEARLSIDDFAVRYGAACFETMLVRHGRVFRIDAHLDRLISGLRAMHATPPPSGMLIDAITATLRANELIDGAVRLTVTAGRGYAVDLDAASNASVVVTAEPPRPMPVAPRLRVASIRIDAARPLAYAKQAQFLPYLLARAEAHAAGADDAMLRNHAGALVEAATANIFVLLGETLVTPPLRDGPLPGITRATVIEVARAIALPVVERTIAIDDVAPARAVLLTSSVAGIVAAAALEAAPPEVPTPFAWQAPSTPSAAVEALRVAYAALVEAECSA